MTKQAKQVYKPCQCGESDCPDTKLIQSAPELLEACKEMVMLLDDNGHLLSENGVGYVAELSRAVEAINKAGGEI